MIFLLQEKLPVIECSSWVVVDASTICRKKTKMKQKNYVMTEKSACCVECI